MSSPSPHNCHQDYNKLNDNHSSAMAWDEEMLRSGFAGTSENKDTHTPRWIVDQPQCSSLHCSRIRVGQLSRDHSPRRIYSGDNWLRETLYPCPYLRGILPLSDKGSQTANPCSSVSTWRTFLRILLYLTLSASIELQLWAVTLWLLIILSQLIS